MEAISVALICAIPIIVVIIITLTIILIVRHRSNKSNQLRYSEYQDKFKKWQAAGYDLSELNTGLKNQNNLSGTIILFLKFEEKINKVLELKSKTEDLNFNFSPEEKKELDCLFKQPGKIKEIEDFLNNYQIKKENIVREQRKEIKILSDKVRENAKDFLDKTINIGDMDLTEVISVLLNNLERAINLYQLGDASFENTKSELNRMLDNIDKLSKTTTETKNRSKTSKTSNGSYTLYDILRVRPDASLEEIKLMRNALVKLFVNNNEELKEINNAYDILKDPSKRKNYNNKNNI